MIYTSVYISVTTQMCAAVPQPQSATHTSLFGNLNEMPPASAGSSAALGSASVRASSLAAAHAAGDRATTARGSHFLRRITQGPSWAAPAMFFCNMGGTRTGGANSMVFGTAGRSNWRVFQAQPRSGRSKKEELWNMESSLRREFHNSKIRVAQRWLRAGDSISDAAELDPRAVAGLSRPVGKVFQ
jgi:hypothetical protein